MKTQLNDQLIDEAADPNHTAGLDQTAPHRNASALNASATASSRAILPPAESPSASPELLRKLEQKRLKALQRKQRADSFLNKLTDAQLAKLLAWFEDEENIVMVYQHVTSSAPDGLGLQVSLPTLRRIRAHITATHSNARTTEILDAISEMDADPSESARIQGAINQLLHEKAFELIRTEPGATELNELLLNIQRLSALDLKRQKLALDREKMLRRAHQASNPLPHASTRSNSPSSHPHPRRKNPRTTHQSANRSISSRPSPTSSYPTERSPFPLNAQPSPLNFVMPCHRGPLAETSPRPLNDQHHRERPHRRLPH